MAARVKAPEDHARDDAGGADRERQPEQLH
jgi:hypothetical protein